MSQRTIFRPSAMSPFLFPLPSDFIVTFWSWRRTACAKAEEDADDEDNDAAAAAGGGGGASGAIA